MKHTAFEISTILNKTFRTDVMQEEYVVVSSLEQLMDSVKAIAIQLENQPINTLL